MSMVIVSGAIANKPFNGGNAWSRLSWISGFQRLGFDVLFIEEISSAACVDASDTKTSFRTSENLRFFQSVMAEFGLTSFCGLICDGGDEVYGRPIKELKEIPDKADLLFNLSGHLTQPELKSRFRRKIYYGDDPGFTQFWHAAGS